MENQAHYERRDPWDPLMPSSPMPSMEAAFATWDPLEGRRSRLGWGERKVNDLPPKPPPKVNYGLGGLKRAPYPVYLLAHISAHFFQAHLEKPGIRPSTVLNQIYHPDSPERSPRGIQPINLIRPYVAQPVRHLAHLNYV